jgi:hypothetical protein
VSAGDVLEAEMDVTGTSLSGLAHVEFGMALSVSGGSGLQISAMSNHGTSTSWTQDFSGVFRSPKFTVPASPTNLNVRCLVVFAGAGGATLKVGRVSVRKVKNAFT